jgi:Protein of Unknown function (DUF2784)
LLADIVLALHVGFVLFVVVGFAAILFGLARGRAWAYGPWLRWTHLAAIVFVAFEALLGIACPLTVWETTLRHGAPGDETFVAHWLRRLLYWDLPPWAFTVAYVTFAAAVAFVLWRHPPRRHGRANRLSSSETTTTQRP